MPKTLVLLSALSLVAITSAATAPRAHAQGLESCGNIHLEAEAQCTVVPPSAECKAECTPINVEAACEARVVAECDGECNFTPPQNCSIDCQAGCMGECMVDPGSFECSAECQASCSGECSGKCSAAANKAECMGKCEGTCSAGCDAGCEGTAPSASCDAKCEASCDTSCEVEADLDCQIDCQADAEAGCVVDVQGGCEADCETMEGALFCDGQYVDHGDNLDECIGALRAVINANVEVNAEGSSRCANGKCEAEGSADVSCAAVPGKKGSGAGVIGLLGASVLALGRRRRRG
jgi:hypothetical protein